MVKLDKTIVNAYFDLKNQSKKEILSYIKQEVDKYGSIQLDYDEKSIGINYDGGLGYDKSICYIYKYVNTILIHCYGDYEKNIEKLEVDVLLEIAKAIDEVVPNYYE